MPTLQEYIALGEYETGLAGCENDDQEEIIRLPLLLRLLSQCQADDMECLEDRAAKYSQAEHIHVLACHLAPAVCRAWQRSRSSNAKKNKQQPRGGKVNPPAVDEEEDNDDEDDDGDVLMTISNVMDEDDEGAPDEDGDDAMNMDDTTAATGSGIEKEDSQEVVLHNTLQELYTKSRSSTAVLSEDSILSFSVVVSLQIFLSSQHRTTSTTATDCPLGSLRTAIVAISRRQLSGRGVHNRDRPARLYGR
jgi:hypothetical protein